jgi:hypothetical protein
MPSSGCGRTGFKDGQLVKPGLGRPGYGGLDWDEGGDRPMDTPSGRGSGHEAATQHDSGGGGDGPHRGDVGGPAPTVTTGGGGPHRGDVGGPAPTVTTGGRRTYKAPPFITTGGNRQFTPFINPKGRRTITGGITGSNRFKKFISKIDPRKLNIDASDSDETGGNLFQMVANMPKYWDLPASLKKAIEAGKNISFAHGTKTLDDYYDLARTGFQTARTKYIPTAYDWLKGTNPFKAEGVFGAVGTKAEDALKAATQYAKGAVLRGGELGRTTGKVFEGMIDPAKAYINRGLTGVIQARVPSDVANRAFNLPEWMSGKSGVKAFTEPGLHRIGSRLLPGANIGLGVASAAKHLQEGNYGQALMAGISAIPGPIGYAGLAGEMGLGALQNLGGQFVPNYQGQRGRLGQFNGGIVSVL